MSNYADQIKQELTKKLKSLSENITDSVGQIANGKPVFCSPEIVNKRLSVCKSCSDYISSTSQCRRCGCFMSAKTRLKVASCPINKWGPDT